MTKIILPEVNIYQVSTKGSVAFSYINGLRLSAIKSDKYGDDTFNALLNAADKSIKVEGYLKHDKDAAGKYYPTELIATKIQVLGPQKHFSKATVRQVDEPVAVEKETVQPAPAVFD